MQVIARGDGIPVPEWCHCRATLRSVSRSRGSSHALTYCVFKACPQHLATNNTCSGSKMRHTEGLIRTGGRTSTY